MSNEYKCSLEANHEGQGFVVLCMLSSYPPCNIHLILKFYVGLKYITAVPSAVLQKMRQWSKTWMIRI